MRTPTWLNRERLRAAASRAAGPVRTVHGSVRAVWSGWSGLNRSHKRRATFALLVVPVAVLGTFTAASLYWTSQPSFCAKCHPMKPFIAGWESSAHSGVNCEECHLPPGTLGFVGGKVASLQVVVDYMRGDYRDESFNAVVSNASCLKCHATVEEKLITKDGIRVSHKGIISLGAKCMSCHATVGHGSATPVGARTYPTMSTCFTCHNGRTAKTTCTICHVQGDWRLSNASGRREGS